ncbi:unnamed protein product [Penicillium salamii]|uniref:SMP-30/Gluconolactonase/LRE-like region domain-containing protein n=1 Tax=Penicillium salamii TaxID=1612424 RepID=A0A9W4N9M2_9EURO|nr:unnamed protein product [Penicillium salamii]CAG8010975.1 unnamed protein product [Penicillium salamii]CAG8068474.1 unnamed protein product [Penicillium salamii]CAG8252103.1 unnamed protein product [Penicillium salamii]CAG8310984.1 unnamed protein product [Penicillium salamii]
MVVITACAFLSLFPTIALCKGLIVGPSVVEITQGYNNVFPYENFNRNVTVPTWDTSLLNGGDKSVIQEDLDAIANATFIVYDSEFYKVRIHRLIAFVWEFLLTSLHQLLGISGPFEEKQVEEVFTFPDPPAYAQRQIHDGSVYVPEENALFVAELFSPKEGYSMQAIPYVWKVDITDRASPNTSKVYPNPPLTIANGAYRFNGSIYWAQEGNTTTPSSIVRMNPKTLETEVVKNNFYGHRFNSMNDIVISNDGVAFFTDGYYGWDNFNDTLFPELANGIWRWDMRTGNIKMVAGAAEGAFFNPNGLAFNHDQSKLFITNRGNSSSDADGARTIYINDVTASGLSNRNVFSYSDAGFPDGIKTDQDNRVYGAVVGSVDVYNSDGTLLGRIKVADGDVAVNMAWADNWLYIFGRSKIYRVELTTTGR